MTKNDPVRSVMAEVTETLTENLRVILSDTLEKQLSEALTQSLLESEFYRRISTDMRSGLRKIYKEVNVAQNAAQIDADDVAESVRGKATADQLFHDASEQLTAVLKQTEDAANTIMSVVEKQMDMQAQSAELLEKAKQGRISPDEWQQVMENNSVLGDDLIVLMTAMSFQDLTGQRIKKAVEAIKQLEATVLELYVSSGLMMQAYEEDSSQDIESIEEKAKARVADITQKVVGSELKGPGEGADQGDIDALLAQFGL